MANVRKNLEASTIGILQQSYTVLMTLAGFILYGESMTLSKVLGIGLIIGGNSLIFLHSKRIGNSKYLWLGVIAYACNVIAGLIDVSKSSDFNLAFYSSTLYFIPAFFIVINSRVKLKDIIAEFEVANKRNYLVTGFCWGIHYLVLLLAYSLGQVSIIAPIASITAITNVAVAYFLLHEKDGVLRKIIAAISAVAGVVLLSL